MQATTLKKKCVTLHQYLPPIIGVTLHTFWFEVTQHFGETAHNFLVLHYTTSGVTLRIVLL